MLHPFIKVVASTIQGHGLVATGLIRAGEVVSRLEPDQPLTALSDFATWTTEAQDDFLIHSYQYSATHLVSEQGDEKYMNHSCDPNTWWADNDTMIARRDIQPGEEITYDYATTDVDVAFAMTCRCGSPLCRGLVTHRDHLRLDWQARFGTHLPQHVLHAIEQARQRAGA
ncbi:MAG: SET domain-containing protein-lysine N-methyltransferase [Anaerolineae bacterium]|jgi:hypothetical protein|nr:SET domain-containing protein-lysine N-methyltransferase [Anaerolineae bacterium]